MFKISPSPPRQDPLTAPSPAPPPTAAEDAVTTPKKKRRPAGTPDPDAEVVSLSPKTLLESDRYVCEICNQGFQRDQNLQMHRRRHKVPWKLLKRDSTSAGAAGVAAGAGAAAARKRVFVCPEPSCLHHDPCHALGDLVGIKKHFRRKHSAHKQWACARCAKAYAVHSDYKAHLKTCGTRGHSCDCGRVFSRVESFIEHQDSCSASRDRGQPGTSHPLASLSRAASSPTPSSDTTPAAPPLALPYTKLPFFDPLPFHSIELQLLPPNSPALPANASLENNYPELHLSLGPPTPAPNGDLRTATTDKAVADEARESARRAVEIAEQELAAARRIRQQAHAEFQKACALRAAATRQINSILQQITCANCQQRLWPLDPIPPAAVGHYSPELGNCDGNGAVCRASKRTPYPCK
ncbi:Zinc finger protein MAGPIE [Apostasia shenzhenica]|uniref:Zinc finger protein MAGPIE n=1 Tax=Apostasia shenzhenica TaxID=1088818 RepID=A0A2I0B4Q6_9ASPA|nr:Zinc finger protein MAGPIE [Apostasia shenzhenica]